MFLTITLFIVLHSEFKNLNASIEAIHTLSILEIDNFQHNDTNTFFSFPYDFELNKMSQAKINKEISICL